MKRAIGLALLLTAAAAFAQLRVVIPEGLEYEVVNKSSVNEVHK